MEGDVGNHFAKGGVVEKGAEGGIVADLPQALLAKHLQKTLRAHFGGLSFYRRDRRVRETTGRNSDVQTHCHAVKYSIHSLTQREITMTFALRERAPSVEPLSRKAAQFGWGDERSERR
jgi:hypothetical protein